MPPLLEWLLEPVSVDQFFREYWERQPLVLRRNRPGYYAALLSLDEVDRALTTLDLRYPNVALKNAAREVAPAEYTAGGEALDVARVYELFSAGSTVTLAYMDDVIPSLAELCRGLEAHFSHPFQANVYLTPPGNQGARIHYDTHDVFVLQVSGTKRWMTYGAGCELPLRNQEFDPAIHRVGDPTLQFELSPGDVAYIPRGHVHQAHTTDAVSLHITVGILAYTWTDFLLESVADVCLSDAAFRQTLPPGFARDAPPVRQAREILGRLLRKLSEPGVPEQVLERFVDEFLAASPPLLRGQMAQLASLDQVGPDTPLEPRPHLAARVHTDAHSISVRHFGRKLTLPLHAAPAVRFALAQQRFTARDLPGDLDEPGKLTLVRRLIREGLLVASAA